MQKAIVKEMNLDVRVITEDASVHIFTGFNENHPDKNWYQVIIITSAVKNVFPKAEWIDCDSMEEMIQKFFEELKKRMS